MSDDHPIFSEDMQPIVESFIVEAEEIFDELDHDLLQLERTPDDQELIDQIFRSVHTVKGTAGFLSLDQMSTLAHRFEDVLNKLRHDEIAFHPDMMDVMFAAFDQMKVHLDRVIEGDMEPVDQDAIIADLDAILDGEFVEEQGAPAEETSTEIEKSADASSPSEGASPDEDVSEESDSPAESIPTSSSDADEPTSNASADEPSTEESNADSALSSSASRSNGSQQSASGPSSRRSSGRASETIRVEVDRLDNLMDLVGELVLGRNRLLQLADSADASGHHAELLDELDQTTSQVDFITSKLQESVMNTRMVQVSRVFNKFPRVVRDLARQSDKKIDLEIEGEDTELDKSLIEEIGDPLTHLIRNAADHGIESPEERREQGKPEQGTIRLAARHEGNHIIIEIEDDGAGIDPEAVKEKAINKGLISQKEAREMTDKEAYDLIFEPGFSTTTGVSQVSGRGVGMDVVKTTLRRLNGSIETESTLGEGTRFKMKLPLTLAIIQSLLVEVGAESFAIPLHAITEVVDLNPDEMYTLKGREVIRHRDRVLPLLRVGETLNVPDHTADDRNAYIIVVALAHHRLGLIVDEVVSQEEIVIKPLGDYLKEVTAIAGSTILGDGSVIMILDVGELIQMRADELDNTSTSSPLESSSQEAALEPVS